MHERRRVLALSASAIRAQAIDGVAFACRVLCEGRSLEVCSKRRSARSHIVSREPVNIASEDASAPSSFQKEMAEISEFLWQRPGEASTPEAPAAEQPPMGEMPAWARWNPLLRRRWRRDWERLCELNFWGWVVCMSPYDRSVLLPDFPQAVKGREESLYDFHSLEYWSDNALEQMRRWKHDAWNNMFAILSRNYALAAAKRLGDPAVSLEELGVNQKDQTIGSAQIDAYTQCIFERMEFALATRAEWHGSTYGRDYCLMLDLLCGTDEPRVDKPNILRLLGAPVAPCARFSGQRIAFCEASLSRVREKFGVGSSLHRWLLAWCIESLRAGAKSGGTETQVRRAWIDELLRLERAAPPVKGMVHLGSAILLAAEDAKRRGDLDEAEAILRQGEVELRGRVEGLPTRYQQIRRELLRNLTDRGKTSDVELLLRDMIDLEQQEHTADEMALRTLMGPAIGWMRVRLARLLERQDRIEEAEQVYRASVGDRFGIHPPNHGLGFLVQFLLRQHRATEAVEAIEEVIRRTRASREPNEHTLMRLLMLHIATIDRYLDRKEDAWRRRIESSIEELVEKARKIEIEPPHNFGSHELVQAAYAVARAGQAEKGIELLRPHLGKIRELKEEERRSQVWLVTMLAFCLEFRE
ncbi:MAG: hypothetical protein RL591_534, partial [Planctomycetota bacterium]